MRTKGKVPASAISTSNAPILNCFSFHNYWLSIAALKSYLAATALLSPHLDQEKSSPSFDVFIAKF